MLSRISSVFSFALLATTLTGCASGGAGGTGEAGAADPTVAFEIDNNLSGITGVTAYLVRDNGIRRTLGPVESGRKAAFSQAVRPGTYTLLVRSVGSELQSERIRIDAGTAMIAWDLRANVVRVATRSP